MWVIIFIFEWNSVIGLHGPSQAGIDFITAQNIQWNEPVAISIIYSGGYEDDEDGGDMLIYTGQGGNNYMSDKKQSVDIKLEREVILLWNEACTIELRSERFVVSKTTGVLLAKFIFMMVSIKLNTPG